jgi:hypothetical protein
VTRFVSLLLAIVGALGSASGVAVADTRVRPSVDPSEPTQVQRVVIRFRARESGDGVYRVQARTAQPGCAAQRSRAVSAPRRGRVVRLTLRPPQVDGDPNTRRWCVGTYRATVYFKQAVRCHPPIHCGDSVEVPRGSTTFTVLPTP